MLKYIITFLLLTLVGYLYDKYRTKMDSYDETENEKLIRKYLLNETYSPNNKPPLWIYVTNEVNARHWVSFGSRNTFDINQPYLYITLRSIINQSNDDFNVCIINDDSIHKLLPAWDIDMNKLADPLKSHFRKLAMTKILYNYGGMFVPPSYIALKPMSELYYTGLQNKECFVVELPSKSIISNIKDTQPSLSFIGCAKQHPVMKDLMESLERLISKDYTSEQDFNGNIERILNQYVSQHKANKVSGKIVGCLDEDSNYVSINELLGSSYINYSNHLHGIFIPQVDVLRRSKYEWFARLNEQQIYSNDAIICKYLLLSNNLQ
jgi:hypothetical protein